MSQINTIIIKYDGEIDKFTGTASLSFFRNESMKDIFTVLDNLYLKLSPWINKINLDYSIDQVIGIGVAYGEVILGKVGPKSRRDFTLIGSTVNLSARLETLPIDSNKELIIHIDEGLKEKFSTPLLNIKELEKIKIKGLEEPRVVYEFIP